MRVEEYECLGAGEYLSKYLIKQYKRANPEPFTLADAALMATFCVEEAIDYDEKCGGDAEIMIMRNDGDIGNAHRTAMYPNYSLPGTLRQEMWKFFMVQLWRRWRVEHQKLRIVEEFCERIREAERKSVEWGQAPPQSPSE